MSLKKKYTFDTEEKARAALEDLAERVDHLEKILKVVYHKQTSVGKSVSSNLHNMSADITNANRKISQATKK